MHCRKNQSSLTDAEKTRFVDAVIALKASGGYDNYVRDHMNFMQGAHRGSAFFPWHREFLRRFELSLRAIDLSVTLPYWNWTVDNSPTSSIWNANFMGGNGRPSDGWVTTGPFAHSTGNWTLLEDAPALRRRFGVGVSSLPSAMDLNAGLAETVYEVAPWDRFSASGFRNRVEGWISGPQLHNRVHVWVGGSMEPGSSPNDPVFFLHHCFIDKLWADWQMMHPGVTPYLPAAGAAAGHNLADPMQPWAGRGEVVTPSSVTSHQTLGYAYDTEAVCRPKLKFLDDPVKFKFRDDHRKFKVLDDPIKLKFRDDIFTSPRLDFAKSPALDKPPAFDNLKAPGSDFGNRFPERPGPVAAPFVLATPHHSMGWARSLPDVHGEEIAQIEIALAELEQALTQADAAAQQGQLSEAQLREARNLYEQYVAMAEEYRRLQAGG